ncbi:MAG: hypothetical protein KGL02_13650 [Acidobacteriota bacterium]|nr:hypothetical protein [Acidobacteriota bacterium]
MFRSTGYNAFLGYLFPAILLIALNAMSVYAVACPILCAADDGAEASTHSAALGITSNHQKGCQGVSAQNGSSDDPCGGSGHDPCVQYHGAFNSVVRATGVQCSAALAFVWSLGTHGLSVHGSSPQTVPPAYTSPPRSLADRDIGQLTSLLRI